MNIIQTWNKAVSVMFFPKREWKVIEVSETTGNTLGYLVIFSILIGLTRFIRLFFWEGRLQAGFETGIQTIAIVLIGTLLVALLTNIYAPNFESKSTFSKALRLITFSLTPVYFGLAIVTLIGFYLYFTLVFAIFSLVLLYIGLPIMLETTDKQRWSFMGLITLTAALLIVIAWLLLRYV
ncbi:MAG: YIP1 family protein [Prevotellaceae bacterium]|jgi:hypothetical protein|nr:YIP1 family protein [Prevotellaceae bacterium]